MIRRSTFRLTALPKIALVLALAPAARAQDAPRVDAGESADCMPSRGTHECPDRCPSYDTCFVPDAARLYYQVGAQRFDCDGLDCAAASVSLGDYCCRRGEFAPGSDGGGGCTVAAKEGGAASAGGVAALGALAALVAWRKRRATTTHGARGARD